MIKNSFTLATILSLVTLSTEAYYDAYHDLNHPILAKIMKRSGEECTGVYYRAGFVITPGSCAYGVRVNDKVILKDESLNQNRLPTYNVVESFIHPKYESETIEFESHHNGKPIEVVVGKKNDIALVQIDIKGNHPNPKKFKIVDIDDIEQKSMDLEGIVWGLEDNVSEIPRLDNFTDYTSLEFKSKQSCEELGGTINSKYEFCIGQPRHGGLSYYEYGSPIVLHDDKSTILVGISSRNQPHSGTSHHSLATKISPYLDWIRGKIEFNRADRVEAIKRDSEDDETKDEFAISEKGSHSSPDLNDIKGKIKFD